MSIQISTRLLCPRCRSGRCATLNQCYPYFKLFQFDVSEQWVMGTYDTCKYSGPTRSYVSAVPGILPVLSDQFRSLLILAGFRHMLSQPRQQADQVSDPNPRSELDRHLGQGGRGLSLRRVQVALPLRKQREHFHRRRRRPQQAAFLPFHCRRRQWSSGTEGAPVECSHRFHIAEVFVPK